MVNDKRFELNEVKSPLLNPDFGNGLEEQFENIDANFKKIANAEYLRGRSGTTTYCFTIKLNRDDDEDTGIWYKNDDEAGQPVSVTSTNILNKLEQVVGQIIEPTIDEQGNVNYPELILFIEDDNQGHKRAVSSMPFIYHDPELVDLLNNKEYQEQDFQDNSGIFLFNGDYFEKATSYPTLYYNKEIGEFCWIINGTETELVARGPQGEPGQNGTCLVVQIGVMSNNNNDSLPFGEQEVDVNGNKIKVPLMYPIRAIMLPDLETGFAWKKLEDFTDDDPVTNYLHNGQIVIAIPNGGNKIELANNDGYSTITWACISPIVTKVGDMFEGGDVDCFFVYANYSNTISNIISNTNLKWILRSVNINSNDLKGLYVSNNPTDIENIEYSPDSANYERTYFPNGVHMMYTDENNMLNFKHTTKPESIDEYKSAADAHMHYNLEAHSFNTRGKVETPVLSFCKGKEIIQGSDDGNLSIYCNDESTESSTIYNKITVRTISSGYVKLTIKNEQYTIPLIIDFDDEVYNNANFHIYNKILAHKAQGEAYYAIPINNDEFGYYNENHGHRSPLLLCCYDKSKDYLKDYEGQTLIENNKLPWQICSSMNFKTGAPWYLKVDSVAEVPQIYKWESTTWYNYSLDEVNLVCKDINFSLVDIKNNICEWICEEDHKVYYSQNPVQEINRNIVLMPKEIGKHSFNEIVGYVKSGETLNLPGLFVSELKDASNIFKYLLDSRIYIDKDTYKDQANMYLDIWKDLMKYNMESIYSYRGKIITRFGTIDNHCQNYYINGQNILRTIDDIQERLNTLSSGVATVSYNNEPLYNGEETVNLNEIQNTILTIQNQLDSISNQIPLMIVESMENDEAVQNAIDNKISESLNEDLSKSIIKDVVNDAILNDDTTRSNIENYISDLLVTESQLNNSITQVVMNVANTQAFKNTLIANLKDVMVTKEEFNQYIKTDVNITEGDSNAS